uniref:lipopolysaccharide transport periplasmic protein LptA n=1 Tax=Thaumasiovibrio occultus TaxID=1891184 RepID=UPI000B35CBD4|nr:lipopolysaccharide transport periplasmic protein LptA [Thaumasiovibrio occultus]
MKRLAISALLVLATSSPAWALSSDTEQPIYINADTQELDMRTNVVEFKGNVVLQQGSIDIRASRVVFERNGAEGREVIRAFGSPATFQQKMDDGTFIRGRAGRVVYTTHNSYLQMLDSAKLEQSGSTIEGNTISYRIDQQKLVAESEQGGRVTTVIQPSAINSQ